jgi:hypothetical protein
MYELPLIYHINRCAFSPAGDRLVVTRDPLDRVDFVFASLVESLRLKPFFPTCALRLSPLSWLERGHRLKRSHTVVPHRWIGDSRDAREPADSTQNNVPNVTTTVAVIVLVISTIILGGLIAVLAHRAARRSNSRPMRLFSIGFGILTLGLALGGVLAVTVRIDAQEGLLIQGVFVVIGLAVLLRSLYMRLP